MESSISSYLKPLIKKLKELENSILGPYYQIYEFIEKNNNKLSTKALNNLEKKRLKFIGILASFYEMKEKVEAEIEADAEEEFEQAA